jgi:pilus assembly protein Flp/PilA
MSGRGRSQLYLAPTAAVQRLFIGSLSVLTRFTNKVVNFLRNEDGPTAVEYAVMLALIIVVCIAAISLLGSNANNTFNETATAIAS